MKRIIRLLCYALAATTLASRSHTANLAEATKDISEFLAKNPSKIVAVLAFKHSDTIASREVTRVQDRLTEQLVAAGTVISPRRC